MKTKRAFFSGRCIAVALSFLLAAFLLSATAHALYTLPEIGVDYQSMQVVDPTVLRNSGMKDVRRGDRVAIQVTQDGKMDVTNARTRETVTIQLE